MVRNRKHKKYRPCSIANPIVISKKVEKLQEKINGLHNLLSVVNKANALHVEHLSNFVRHDMKNAIQGIDGIIYNAKQENTIPQNILEELEIAISLLRQTVEKFSGLIPSTKDNITMLPKLLNAVEVLTRSDLQVHNIKSSFVYDRQSEEPIYCSFQSLLQVIHNLIVNAKKEVDKLDEGKILIKAVNDNGLLSLKIYDNGNFISTEKAKEIYKYGYSTTGGTGIGLFHAKYVVEEMNGIIDIRPSDIEGYTKYFIIEINSKNNE